jgi:hypothetical protein
VAVGADRAQRRRSSSPAGRPGRTGRARSRSSSGAASTGRTRRRHGRQSAGSASCTTCRAAAPSWRRLLRQFTLGKASTRCPDGARCIATADGVDRGRNRR